MWNSSLLSILPNSQECHISVSSSTKYVGLNLWGQICKYRLVDCIAVKFLKYFFKKIPLFLYPFVDVVNIDWYF